MAWPPPMPPHGGAPYMPGPPGGPMYGMHPMAGHHHPHHYDPRGPDRCPFFSKMGACRHGDKCTKFHFRPPSSQTILLPFMYLNPKVVPLEGQDEQGNTISLEYDKKYLKRHVQEFYEDVFTTMMEHGRILEMYVCDNICEHLLGNVYVKFENDSQAAAAMMALENTAFNGVVLMPEFCPVIEFGDACCKEDASCSRGLMCNYLHIIKMSSKLIKKLMKDQEKLHGPPKDPAMMGGGGPPPMPPMGGPYGMPPMPPHMGAPYPPHDGPMGGGPIPAPGGAPLPPPVSSSKDLDRDRRDDRDRDRDRRRDDDRKDPRDDRKDRDLKRDDDRGRRGDDRGRDRKRSRERTPPRDKRDKSRDGRRDRSRRRETSRDRRDRRDDRDRDRKREDPMPALRGRDHPASTARLPSASLCHICGEIGHISRDCPMKNSA